MFRRPIYTGLIVEDDIDSVDETAATAEQRRPEDCERWWPIEQLRLFDVRRNRDTLSGVVLAAGKVLIEVNIKYLGLSLLSRAFWV